jgi:hypothetical protein
MHTLNDDAHRFQGNLKMLLKPEEQGSATILLH